MFKKYTDLLYSKYPSTAKLNNLPDILDNLISNEVIRLKQSVYERVQNEITAIYKLSQSEEYLTELRQIVTPGELDILNSPVNNDSVVMGYDFHYDLHTDELSLVEVNTNAAAFLFVENLYHAFGAENSIYKFTDAVSRMKTAFERELKSLNNSTPNIAIIDENVEQQKMYSEFCMYNDLFKSWGWSSNVYEFNDPRVLTSDFVYNRYTDFILAEGKSAELRKHFLSRNIIFSPNPKEYIKLADKSRFLIFSNSADMKTIIPTEIVKTENADRLWADRKKLFFKPKNSFGSKATYRGSSISRKYFELILNENFIAQEFRPPGELNGWKYDLRFYVYQNEIHLVCARLYKGQVTNFATPGGGLARVEFI